MSIEGPGKVDIKCFENPGGTCRVAYNPSEPGTYQLSVKYADEHIPGHPVHFYVRSYFSLQTVLMSESLGASVNFWFILSRYECYAM